MYTKPLVVKYLLIKSFMILIICDLCLSIKFIAIMEWNKRVDKGVVWS